MVLEQEVVEAVRARDRVARELRLEVGLCRLDEKPDKLRVWVEVMVYICGFVGHVVVVVMGVMLVLWLWMETSFMLVLYFIFYRVGSLYAYVYVY